MANIGYRTFDGVSDRFDANIGNLASGASAPETFIFAGRILTVTVAGAGEIVSAPGYDPLDFYVADAGGGFWKYQFYNGAVDAGDGPTWANATPVDQIMVVRRGAGVPVKWSIATWSGSAWSTFTHTTSSVTFANRPYPASGVLEFFNGAPLNARCALVARCSAVLSDTEVATLTTDLTAWTALASLTNLWRFDGASVVDLKGTATSNALTGTTVTANGFPLADSAASPTGTAAITAGAATPSASGTAAIPITGSGAVTLGAATSAGAGKQRNPHITASNTTAGTSLGTNLAVTKPPNAVGDLVLCFVTHDNPGTTAITAGTGWTAVGTPQVQGSNVIKAAIFGRVLDGSGSDALTVSGTIQDYVISCVVVPAAEHIYTNATVGSIPTAAAVASSAGNADPPSLSPSPGADDYLWIATASVDLTTGSSISGVPTNFTLQENLNSANSTSSVAQAISWQRFSGSTLDPGTFTNTSRVWISYTVAIRPASSSSATGTGAPSLSPATSTAVGVLGTTGTASPVLGTATSSASGGATTGTLAKTLPAATSSASGTHGNYIVYDDFPGTSLDTTKWRTYNRLGDQANSEQNAVIPANARVSGGQLLIDAKFEDVTIGDRVTAPYTVHYTTAQVTSKQLFLYGDIRVRAKIPAARGTWPCLWMLDYTVIDRQPYDADDNGNGLGFPEIDFAEFMSGARTSVNCQVHWDPGTGQVNPGGVVGLPYDSTTRYMVYRLVWGPGSAVFSVDPEDGSGFTTIQTITGAGNVPNIPMYVICHIAIGGAGGTPVSSDYPDVMQIDSVQVLRTASTIDVTFGSAAVTAGAAGPSASGRATISGAAANLLAAATSAASGGIGMAGTGAPTLAAATPSAIGTIGHTGTAGVTAGAATSTTSGSAVPPGVSGAGSPGAAPATSSSTGTIGHTGTAAATLTAATGSAIGTVGHAGSAAVTTSAATSSGSGVQAIPGSAAAVTGAATSTASGSHVPVGSAGNAADTAGPATSSASGATITPVTGTASVTLAFAAGAASGTIGVTGASAITLAAATGSVSGTVGVTGTADVILVPTSPSGGGTFTPAMRSGVVASVLPLATSTADGIFDISVTGGGGPALAAATAAATGLYAGAISGTATITLGRATSSALGSAGNITGDVGGVVSVTWMSPTVTVEWATV